MTGCANQDVVLQKQAELESRLERLVQVNSAASSRIDQLTNEVRDMQSAVKGNAARIDDIRASQQTLQQTIEMQQRQAAPPSVSAALAKIELVNHDAQPQGRDGGPPEAYVKAFGLYSANDYAAAITAFESFITANPGSEYAGNALYWIGESHYTQSDLPRALAAFNKVVELYPKGNKVPDAMLKSGFTLYAMKEPERAKSVLEALLQKYPKSPASIKARERLNRH